MGEPGSRIDGSARRSRCPVVALAATVLGAAGTTALLAPRLAAAGIGTAAAFGAACLAAMFAVVLVIVSLSVLAALIGFVWRPRGAAPAAVAQASPAGTGPPACDGGACVAAPFTGIVSVSGRYWPFRRASPRRAVDATPH
ncbi:hypothetical protein [Massilia sp. YMA4]|uniref:hypothetical protein n=1 Tax=Massilia sp. YMA4 TaxID=1593482 RepID=UPI001582DD0B|nr:hypothetical protein [Massilia sp. YMA4]